ncbi:hypothetical protein N665_0408s0003 [Sinapis alba]|nr:hypothetical protein N665_0408s0003 [Sinapis alba]
MDHDKTGCQSPPEDPKLCCHKAVLFQQEQGAKFASSMSGTSSPSNIIKETFTAALVDAETKTVELMVVSVQPSYQNQRMDHCDKRISLTGFKCRCGEFFCGTHCFADVHNCSFNYHAAAQEAIAKASPIVKAEKLDNI